MIYHLLRRFVRKQWIRTVAFIAICMLVAWRGVNGSFRFASYVHGSALGYLIIVDVLGRRSRRAPAGPVEAEQAQPAF